MSQQINLYKREIFEKRILLSARHLLWIGLGLVGFLTLVGAAGEWQLRQMNRELLESQQREAKLQSTLLELQKNVNDRSHLLSQEVARLRAERDHRLLLLGKIKKDPSEMTPGFSPYLAGLARQTVPGLWLRRIVLREGGKRIRLEGSAGQPEEVPRLVRQLSAESAFSGLEFARLQIERSEEDGRPIDFILTTQPLEEQ